MALSAAASLNPAAAEAALGIQPGEGDDTSAAATIAGLTDLGILSYRGAWRGGPGGLIFGLAGVWATPRTRGGRPPPAAARVPRPRVAGEPLRTWAAAATRAACHSGPKPGPAAAFQCSVYGLCYCGLVDFISPCPRRCGCGRPPVAAAGRGGWASPRSGSPPIRHARPRYSDYILTFVCPMPTPLPAASFLQPGWWMALLLRHWRRVLII